MISNQAISCRPSLQEDLLWFAKYKNASKPTENPNKQEEPLKKIRKVQTFDYSATIPSLEG